MSIKIGILSLMMVLSGVFSNTLVAAEQSPAQPTQEQIVGVLREKLYPVVEATLQEHCGSDCPSFRIDPQFRKTPTSILDDLGFSRPALPSDSPELKSISISILASDKISLNARDSLTQILSNRVSNEVTVPVSIHLKPLKADSPVVEKLQAEEKRKQIPQGDTPLPLLEVIKPIAWPLTLVTLGILGLIGLVLFLKHQLKVLRTTSDLAQAREVAREARDLQSTKDMQSKGVAVFETSFQNLLMERVKDLQWLIEEKAALKDQEALMKAVSIFPAEKLTSQLRLSEQALRVIAWLPSGKGKTDLSELSNWIKKELDRAHWRRMEEERNPLKKLERLSDDQLLESFLSLPSLGEKAVLISSISKDRWPTLLARLNSDVRVQLGVKLAQYQAAAPADRRAMEAALIQRVTESLDGPLGAQEGVVEDFTLYLPEKEGQKLWQELSVQSHSLTQIVDPLSVDSILQRLEPTDLLEVCMNVDIKTLKALLPTVSAATRARVLEALPKSLRDRLDENNPSSQGSISEALLMKSKAEIVRAYRKLHAQVES